MAPESIGERVRRLRNAAGLSQNEVAKRLGVTPQTVFQWEKGERFPRPANQPPLAELLGVSATYLLTGQELSGEERSVPPEVARVYDDLGDRERVTWLRLGWVLRDQQAPAQDSDEEQIAAFSEPELAEEARRESEDFGGA